MNIDNNEVLNNNLDIKYKCKYHTDSIMNCTVLNDGRFATCSSDKSIIIYNNKTFKPDLIIKEHNNVVNDILQLSSGMLASCSDDNTIKIFNIKNKNYEVFQTLKYHKGGVIKIIELTNKKNLISCSDDYSFIVYSKDNNKYTKEYQIKNSGPCYCIIQTRENEICYHENDFNNSICFFDLFKRKKIDKINFLSELGYNSFNMITKDLLLITGGENMSLINVNQHKIVRRINIPDTYNISASCMLCENILLTGDDKSRINIWRINGDNLKIISTKENVHDNVLNVLMKLEDGLILSGSADGEIAILNITI